MMAMLELLFLLPLAGLALLATAIWIWMLVDCATKESSAGNDKLIWVLVILFTHLLGAMIYFFIRRPQRKRELGA